MGVQHNRAIAINAWITRNLEVIGFKSDAPPVTGRRKFRILPGRRW